jgi:hypothetical protein
MPMEQSYSLQEVNEELGDPHGLGGPIFADAEEKARVRRLTYALLHDLRARRLLSRVTLRRDAYLVAEGRL